MEIHIRNMVCPRCIMAVEKIFDEAQIKLDSLQLGVVHTKEVPDERQWKRMEEKLTEMGFEIIVQKKERIVEQIKNIIITEVHHTEGKSIRLSDLLFEHLQMEYKTLSQLFSQAEGKSIEKYLIIQKVEYIKELLEYNQLTISEIAFKLGYSSAAHLSTQFKQATGVTPTQYRSDNCSGRRPIDSL